MKYIAGLKWSKIQLKFDLTFGKTYCSARNVNCNNKTFTDVYPSLRKKASVFGVILVRISPAFGLNTERYGQSISPYSVHAGKMRTRITPKMDTFYAVICKSHFKYFKENDRKMPPFKTILRILEELQHKFKKSSLVSANRPGENLSPGRIVDCVSEYIFLISKVKQTSKKTKQQQQEYKKAEETREKRVPPENRLKKDKFAAVWVKIFLVTRISGNESFFFFLPIVDRVRLF